MSDLNENGPVDLSMREALARREQELAGATPGLEMVRSRIVSSTSPMDAPRWDVTRSVRVTMTLIWAQVRVVPWLVVPVALASAGMAVLAARFFGVGQDAGAATSGFASLMLLGVVVTVAMGLSHRSRDAVTLTTPIGPRIVLFARVTVVLAVDVGCGLAASALAAAWGVTEPFPELVGSWLIPLAAVAGLVTFLSVWTLPWVGVLFGVTATPLLVPLPADAVRIGVGAVAGWVQDAVPPVVIVGAGVLLFAVAIVTAKRPLVVPKAAS